MLYFLMATSGFAQTDVNLILEKIQKRNKDLSSLEADFIQVTTNEAFPEPIEQSGHLFAMRPKFLRWDFQVPMVQSYYTDGKSITVWNEQNNQVLISEEMSDANEAFDVLTDFSNAQKKYNITMKEESELSYVFSVIPKEATAFEKLEITMDKKELWITNFVVESTETGRVSLSFSNIQRNGVTDTGLFSFVPPEGAEVIRP
jgi:outer membrane lipoprotein carrier protein